MWIFSRSDGKTLHLLPGKQYIVGRKNSDLVLEGDQSISRKHAIIIVGTRNLNSGVNSPGTTVKLVDENSKYGTFVQTQTNAEDWVNLSHGIERVLVNEDIIRFGLLENKWKLCYVPLIVTTSNMQNTEKQKLKDVLASIDGHNTNAWEHNCTHLTMSKITLTIKALRAMVFGKPIVLPTYWDKYLEKAESNEEPPDYKEFIPPLNEPAIDSNAVSFVVNEERKHVFNGKHFVFASQLDLKELGCIATAAGATVSAFEEYGDSFDQLCRPHIIVVSLSFITSRSASSQSVHLLEAFQNATRYMASRGRRVIADQEIGLAILYCSTERYCNPTSTLTGVSSGNSNASQVQCSRVSLDFSSQAVNLPTQDTSRDQLRSVQGRTSVQQVTKAVDNQTLSGGSTSGFSLANRVSKNVLLTSPIKIEPITSSEQDTTNSDDKRKRVRSLVLDDPPAPKRFAAESPDLFRTPRTRSLNVSSRDVSVKFESDDDLFDFPSDNPVSARIREDNYEVDAFTFTNESNLTAPKTVKQEKSSHQTDALDDDLFGTVPKISLQSLPAQHDTLIKRSSEVETEPRSCGSSTHQEIAFESKIKTQKRKNASINEEVIPRLKKIAPSLDDTPRTSISEGKTVSLKGFLDATSLETDEMDDLADDVMDIILMDSLLVIRERKGLSISLDKTKNGQAYGTTKNFKKFRKVLPVNKRILPRIIGGNDLYVYSENYIDVKWNTTASDNGEDDDLEMDDKTQKDIWDFPTPKSKNCR